MKRTTTSAILLAALAFGGAAGVMAQEPPARRGMGPRGEAVEGIMRLRERLELTEEQIAQLDAIRAEIVALRSEQMAEMAEMRSQLEAGQIRRSELVAFMEERRDAAADRRTEHRERIEAVLTEEQLGTLTELRAEGRASFRRGRDGMRRGPRGDFDRWGDMGRRGSRRGPGAGQPR